MADILVVDDEESVRSSIARTLALAGHSVTEAASGLEALNLVGTKPFALALVDVYMPQMDGLELIPKLLIQVPALKVVAMSGGMYGGKGVDLLRAAERAGAVKSLTKPFGMEELEEVLGELLP
ncbi:MAG TPA: response regulator [Gemmatimonadales bacterium]|nr:response regulator [Gemmatimonadales bacterium]